MRTLNRMNQEVYALLSRIAYIVRKEENMYIRGAFGTLADNDPCSREIKKCDHDERHETKVALNSATGGAGPLPAIAVGDLTTNLSVVSVTIDARFDPSVLLTFTTQVNFPTAFASTLVFQVLRTSAVGGAPINVGPAITYARTVTALTSETFSFQLFDSDLPPGTYTYSVVLTPTSTTGAAGLTLINATLSAFAVG
jgi:hypothetical protein